MWSYVTEELPGLIAEHFRSIRNGNRSSAIRWWPRRADCGVAASRRYRAASAFHHRAPSQVPWGIKALGGISATGARPGADTCGRADRRRRAVCRFPGRCRDADPFLTEQLRPELLERACSQAGIPLILRHRPATITAITSSHLHGDHLRWHAARLHA